MALPHTVGAQIGSRVPLPNVDVYQTTTRNIFAQPVPIASLARQAVTPCLARPYLGLYGYTRRHRPVRPGREFIFRPRRNPAEGTQAGRKRWFISPSQWGTQTLILPLWEKVDQWLRRMRGLSRRREPLIRRC